MPRLIDTLRRLLLSQPIWLFAAACVVVFGVSADHFLDVANFRNILVQSSTIGLIALGMTLVMINGNIDLSVGSTLAFAACLAVDLQSYGIPIAVAAALLSGIALGGLNGLIVWKTGVDSFIVTLGAMIGIRGLVFVYTKEQSFFASDFSYSDFGASSIGPVPTLAAIFLAAAVILHLVLTRTVHGRTAYAVGGNREAAINAGIRVGLHMTLNFVILGFLAALAGVTLSTQMGASTPTLGQDFELWTITAVVLGGTKLKGGAGGIVGTVGGVFSIGLLRNGMDLVHVPAFYVLVVMGVVLIAVLFIDRQVSRAGPASIRM